LLTVVCKLLPPLGLRGGEPPVYPVSASNLEPSCRRLLKPLGTVLPGSLRRGGDSGTQDSANSFRLGAGRSASATADGAPRGDSSSLGSDSGRAAPAQVPVLLLQTADPPVHVWASAFHAVIRVV
jgi:hypothetical protein